MKVSEQCGIAARKGDQLLGMIRRNITYRERKLMVPLYKAIVRPHLDYCIQAWRPHLRKDIDKLEWVQRSATRVIPEMQTQCYEDCLILCNLTLYKRYVSGRVDYVPTPMNTKITVTQLINCSSKA